jgi:hypothetical protein
MDTLSTEASKDGRISILAGRIQDKIRKLQR